MDVCQEETEYKWFEAAKFYEQKLKFESPSWILAAESWQKIGFCYDLASSQAKDTEEFKSLRRLGIRAYERAADFFDEENKKEYGGKREYCLAIAEYLRSWLAADSSEKIKILDKCRAVAKKAMAAFKTVGNDLCYGQTANLMSKVLYECMSIASTGVEKNEIGQEGMDNARGKAIFAKKNKREIRKLDKPVMHARICNISFQNLPVRTCFCVRSV